MRARLSRRVGAGFHGSGGVIQVRRDGWICWSVGVREGVQPFDRVRDEVGPGPVGREPQLLSAGGGDELGRGGEQPQAQVTRLPPAGKA